ncbi:Uncharacterised protein [uncultured Ruminococcus sp.]|nr:Uncharacterised protein [uncultured Ruminococcus sp.]
MSESLETLIDKYVDSQQTAVFSSDIKEVDKDTYISAVKMQLTSKIYNEIRDEVRDEALMDADNIIEKKAGQKRIKEFKNLMIDGAIVAFFVGMLVNQVTELLGVFKNMFKMNNVALTSICSMLLLFICIAIFGARFLSEALRILRREKNEEN